MPSSNTQNAYLDDYSYANRPVQPERDPALNDEMGSNGWEEGYGDEIGGAGEYSQYQDGANPQAQLNALQQRLQTSGLSPEQQQSILDELNELTAMPEGENFAEGMDELEVKLNEKLENSKSLKENEELIKKLKADLEGNKDMSDREKKDALKRIAEFEKQLQEDPGLQAKDELGDLIEAADEYSLRQEAKQKEAQKIGEMGGAIASALDSIFLGKGGGDISNPAAGGWDWDPRKEILLDWLGVGDNPIGGAIGGLVACVTGYETSRPHSNLKGPQAFKDLDFVMGGKSGLGSTPAPGEIVRILSNMELSTDDQINQIKKALGNLPEASQTFVLSQVVTTLEKHAPEMLSFLKEYSPEVVGFLSKEIKSGLTAIQGGSLAGEGGDGYKVEFAGDRMKIVNTDTKWYRNDWNGFDIFLGPITESMTQALSDLEGTESNYTPPATDPSAGSEVPAEEK